MKRLFLGIAALALLCVTTESASAQVIYGGGYGWGSPGIGVSYGTRVGNSGFLSVGYNSGYAYPAYGYSYAVPAYGYTYAAPAYYSSPVYYSAPAYYASPSIGVSYYRGGWGRGWGRGWGYGW